MNEKYFEILYKLATKAESKGEVPVSALIVKDNKVISKAYNTRVVNNNPLNHAEIKCIVKAAKKLGDWRLDDCDLYTTLEPCHMCKEIIKESRIKNVYYYVDSQKVVNYRTKFNKIDLSISSKYYNLLTSFFKKLR